MNTKLKLNKEQLDSGPVATRGKDKCCSFTDPLFAPIFIAAMVAMVLCAVFGWYKGNPDMLLIGWDSDQNGCGYSDATADYPFLYWPQMPDPALISEIEAGNYDNIIKLLEYGACVKECPAMEGTVSCKETSTMQEKTDYY